MPDALEAEHIRRMADWFRLRRELADEFDRQQEQRERLGLRVTWEVGHG